MKTRGFHGRVSALSVLAVLLSLALAPPARAELEFLTQWGSPKPGELGVPVDVDRDNAGNTYVLDALTRTVTKYDAADTFMLRWGSLGTGPGQFTFPSAIGVNEASGEVYVADFSGRGPTAAARIQRFDASGNFIGLFGSFGTAEGQFDLVSGIAVQPVTGDVYVADGHRIQRFDASGQFELMWGKDVDPGGGTGAETCTGGCKQAETGTAGGEFRFPTDVAVSGNSVFVSEDANKRIQRFDATTGAFQIMGGKDVDPAGGQGPETCVANCQAGITGTGLGELEEPRGLDVNPAFGFVYIVDQGNHRVQRWTGLNPLSAIEFGSEGSGDGQFLAPDALTENQGQVLVADSAQFRLQRFIGQGVFQARIGEPGPSTLTLPLGIAAGSGGVYVTDALHRVARFDPVGAFLGAWGTQGSAPGQFSNPLGIATDAGGDVYVADRGNDRIQRFDDAGATLGTWGSTGGNTNEFDDPVDVAAGPGANVYTLESGTNSRIQKFTPIGAFLGTWGAAGDAPGQFGGAEGVATDADGNVYVADTGNDRIQKFDPNGNLLTAWGTTGTGNGEFNGPADVAVDSVGNVYVADRDNNRVQRFDPNGNFLGRWGANGGDGTAGEGPGEFYTPTSIAVDGDRDIYVLDLLNSRVQKFARADVALLAPELSLYGNKRQNARRLRVIVTCGGAPCRLRLSGKVVARGGGSRGRRAHQPAGSRRRGISLPLKKTTVTLEAGESETVKLKLKQRKRGLRRISAALERGARGTVILRGVATNDAGSDKAKRRVKLKVPRG